MFNDKDLAAMGFILKPPFDVMTGCGNKAKAAVTETVTISIEKYEAFIRSQTQLETILEGYNPEKAYEIGNTIESILKTREDGGRNA